MPQNSGGMFLSQCVLAGKRVVWWISLSFIIITTMIMTRGGASSLPSPGEITDVQVPDSIPVDLKAKLIVCLIHTKVKAPLEVNCFLPAFLIVMLRDRAAR